MHTTTRTLPALPVTVDVTDRGVTVESGTRTVAMSRFSARAQRLTLALGHGTHVLTADDVDALDDVTAYDVADALA